MQNNQTTIEDKKLVCRDCGVQFTWTKGEQEFFATKGFTNSPTRCPECRKKNRTGKKDDRNKTPQSANNNLNIDIKCSKCGKISTVNFQPKNPNNLLCAECFEKQLESNPAQ